jgi:hypothetical protein
MADRLIVYMVAGEHYQHRVCWEVDGADGREEGLCLGDACDDAGRNHRVASEAAATVTPDGKDRTGFYWHREKDADTARKVANTAYKHPTNRPWPEWATTALAAGWRAPKGWNP